MKKIACFIISIALLATFSLSVAAADPKHTYGVPDCRIHAIQKTCWSDIYWSGMYPYARARFENGNSITGDTNRISGTANSARADTNDTNGNHDCVPKDSFWVGRAYYGSQLARSGVVYGVDVETSRTFITNESLMQMGVTE